MRLLRNLTFIITLIMIGGCATTPRPAGGRALAPEDLKKVCERHHLHCEVDPYTHLVTIYRDRDKAMGLVGGSVVTVKGKIIHLSAPLSRHRSQVIVPSDFKTKVVDELVREVSHSIQKYRKIVVDAGHGGKDPGAIGPSGAYEKTIVLDIARRLKNRLEAKGVQVIMTRDGDEFISLQERTEIASRVNPDLFVSIHANSSPARSARGMEIYYLRYMTAAEKEEPQIQSNRKAMFRTMKMTGESKELNDIVFDMLYDYKQAESRRLAEYVVDNATRMVQANGRGSKTAGFFVLKNTLVPAILVEAGFLSNRQEEERLLDARYRQDLADALAETILRYARKNH